VISHYPGLLRLSKFNARLIRSPSRYADLNHAFGVNRQLEIAGCFSFVDCYLMFVVKRENFIGHKTLIVILFLMYRNIASSHVDSAWTIRYKVNHAWLDYLTTSVATAQATK
jgi:hypothetical protein